MTRIDVRAFSAYTRAVLRARRAYRNHMSRLEHHGTAARICIGCGSSAPLNRNDLCGHCRPPKKDPA